MAINILILDEGSPGHCAQSEGIVDLLERQGLRIQREKICVRNRLPGLFRGLMRKLIAIPAAWLNEACLALSSVLESQPTRPPDLIISSGGKSAFASLVLKRRYRAGNIFVGVPDPFPDRWFDLIVSPTRRDYRTASLVSGLIPNSVTPERVAAAGERYWQQGKPSSPCWALLIGANSKSHHYSDADWQGLVAGVNALSQRLGVRWLITTSRRTPPEVEQLLDEELDRDNLVELVLYNREPKRVMLPFLAAAQRVLVTQDSLTMASEALCSGRPVTLLTPSELRIDKGSYFEEIVNGFHQLQGVQRCALTQLAGYQPDAMEGEAPVGLDRLGRELVDRVTGMVERTTENRAGRAE
ncbi:mitochondrial fission ELM1 family protein [Marinobacterium sp. D7]|uniref:ELM1/GtrOC1 family putative glycosyltransferase n=1 Tax=Marinobacterium ramblicola TaxID=2849041 RepID=UPI001C2CDFB4|nr:mitochondrial fission ELM1 family protein [Marinobacterium ramblicola]